MALYMLDTDTVSYALKGVGNVSRRILEHSRSTVCMSSIALAELRFGAALRQSKKIAAAIDGIRATIAVLPFDDAAADRFGELAAKLARIGTPIGEYDTLIAAHALALRATLVTNNTRHFVVVPGLKVENWL